MWRRKLAVAALIPPFASRANQRFAPKVDSLLMQIHSYRESEMVTKTRHAVHCISSLISSALCIRGQVSAVLAAATRRMSHDHSPSKHCAEPRDELKA